MSSSISFSEWVHRKKLDEEVGPHCISIGDDVRLLVGAKTAETYIAQHSTNARECVMAMLRSECIVKSANDDVVTIHVEERDVIVPRRILRKR